MQGELQANRDQQETRVGKKNKYSWKERKAWWTPVYLRGLKMNCGWTQIFDFSRNSVVYQRILLKATFIQHVNPFLWQQLTRKGPPHTALRNLQSGHQQDLVDASNPPSWTATTITSALQSSLRAFPHHCHIPFSATLSDKDPLILPDEGSIGNALILSPLIPAHV